MTKPKARKIKPLEISGDLKVFLADVEIWFWEMVIKLGGFYNAHAHLDRANTNHREFWKDYHFTFDPFSSASLPLAIKQNLVGEMHRGIAYTWENLLSRMGKELVRQIRLGHSRVTTFIDATPDLGKYHGDPLIAIKAALELKRKYEDQVELTVIPHPIFGFKADADDRISRLEVFREAVKLADGIGGLPERDFLLGPRGYTDNVRELLRLGLESNKPVHIHVDQSNNPNEDGSERVLQAVHQHDATCLRDKDGNRTDEPMVWLIHAISPSGYSDERFDKLANGLAENNIGVIVCPSAALGMRQLRPIQTPTHNSIARVLELIDAGVQLRIGTDNIEDVFVPFGSGRILTEIMNIAGDAIRFYVPSVWAKLAAGQKLNSMDIASVREALKDNDRAFEKYR